MNPYVVRLQCTLLLICAFLSSSCATIVLSKHQQVTVTNAPARSSLRTHTGQRYTLSGNTPITLTRSRKALPFVFACGSKSQTQIIGTSPNLWFLIGNIFFWGPIGWLVDGLGKYGWDYDDFIVFPYDLKQTCRNRSSLSKPSSSPLSSLLFQPPAELSRRETPYALHSMTADGRILHSARIIHAQQSPMATFK